MKLKDKEDKIGHFSRSSSIQRSKTTEEVSGNFEKFGFPSIEKRWTKDKETDGQKEKKKKEKRKKEKKIKEKKTEEKSQKEKKR